MNREGEEGEEGDQGGEGEDCDPPSRSTRTSGKLQDNQQSRMEQAEQVDPRKLFNDICGCPTILTYTGYQVVLNPKRYFKLGRVFMTLWTEPKGCSTSSDGGVQVESDHRMAAFSEIRLFVVVRAKAGHCLCVPISTYRGQGTLKHTAQPAQDHAVIVAFGDEPQLQPGELELTKQPLRVICEDPTLQKLHPASRINFAKLYTIEYNIRVRTFGRIATESLPLLQKYFLDTIAGTRDADEDTSLHSKRDASRSPDQSARALDAEPFRTPTLRSAADHTVSQHAKLTYVPQNGHERRHDSYATPTGASSRPSMAHKPSVSHPQSLDSRSSTLSESSEEQTRTSNPRASHGLQSAKISSNAGYQVPQSARLQAGRTDPRQAAENGDEFGLSVFLGAPYVQYEGEGQAGPSGPQSTALRQRSPRWDPNATTELQHPKPVLEPRGEQPAYERPVAVPASATTSDRVYSTTTRGTASHLSELAKEFIKVSFGDYGACQEFIDGHPEIKDESLGNFQEEAIRLQRDGNTSQLRNCVEKLLLLWEISKMSDDDCRVFFSRMKVNDPTTLKGFLTNFDKIIYALAAVRQANPTNAHGRRTDPEPVSSGDSRQSQVLAGIRHAPERSRYTDFDDSLYAPMDKLSVSTTEPDSSWGYGAGGNNTKPPPATRHSTTGRRETLSSVDDDSPLNLFTDNQPDGGALSIVERKIDLRGDREELDPRYHARSDAAKFFTIGRVFAMLWHESARAPQSRSLPAITSKYGEAVYSHIIRVAVVKQNHGFCLCIPIHTYNGQGVLKKGLNRHDQEAHAIIHMDNTAPGSTSEEEKRLMVKKPIAVRPATPDQALHKMSRLNFAKIYTVQWNVKVMNVGKVTQDSMPLFISYWRSQLEQ